MIVEDVRFLSRQRRRNLTWDVIILVDQSASMASSLLHSAVMASILAGFPACPCAWPFSTPPSSTSATWCTIPLRSS